jgi:hypothetical protein
VSKPPDGFVPLQSLKPGAPQPEPLAELRRIYFKTTKQTIDNDFAHAIELLKRLPSEEERQKAHVYMEGLAEMRKEWLKRDAKALRVTGGSERKGRK